MSRGKAARRRTPRSPRTPRSDAVSATDAKNNFGRILARAAREGAVYITRHDQLSAVVLSVRRYEELMGGDAADLDELRREFDEMLARMQTPEATAAMDALFEMSPAELGEAAVRGAGRAAD